MRTLALASVVACLATSNLLAQAAPGVELRPAATDRVETLRRAADGDTVRRVTGRFVTAGASRAERADAFVTAYGAWFGVDGSVELADARPVAPRDPDVVRLAQHVHGFEVLGHGLTLSFDDAGRVTSARGVVSEVAAGLAPPALAASQAPELALDHAGLSVDELAGSPVVRPVVRLGESTARLVYRVEVVRDLIPLGIEIDASTGALLRVFENTVHGSGTFELDGQGILFDTGNGTGGAYKSVGHARAGKDGKTGLKHLTREEIDPTYAPDGSLTGRFSQVVDATGLQVISPIYDFWFDDKSGALIGGFFPEYQLFDHSNTYYWLSRAGEYWSKVLGTFAGDYAVLAYTNFDDGGAGYVNAFYSPSDPDSGGSGLSPGYFVFGEFSNITGDPMDDLSRDPSIVCHEYAHMVVDKEGALFGSADLDTPPRAVNEALADYAAASFLKNPRLGEALVANGQELDWGGADELRDLADTVTLPTNLWDVVGFTTLLPEEHEAGKIFGAALWRARTALKGKTADATILTGLAAWPQTTAEVGYPVVTPANATAAYSAFYYACFEAMADGLVAGGKKGVLNAGRLLGAFLAHGITGTGSGDVYSFDAAAAGLKLSFQSAFLGGATDHIFDLDLAQGQTLSISVVGVAGTTVDFDFDDTPGEGVDGDFVYGKPKKVNSKGTKASQAKTLVATGRTYRLTITDTAAAGGRYKLKLTVK